MRSRHIDDNGGCSVVVASDGWCQYQLPWFLPISRLGDTLFASTTHLKAAREDMLIGYTSLLMDCGDAVRLLVLCGADGSAAQPASEARKSHLEECPIEKGRRRQVRLAGEVSHTAS